MEWLFLESLVALLVLVFIVWWTMRPDRRRGTDDPQPPVARED